MINQYEPPTFHRRVPRPPRRRANLVVTAEHLATLLNLPPDVTVGAFALDPLRDGVVFALDSARFDVVPEGCEATTLVADLDASVDETGVVTQRVTWPGLEGAEVTVRFGGDTYQRRNVTARARQWLGDEAEVRALCPDFHAVGEDDRGDDPDATGQLLAAPHSTWVPVYDGDWVVQRGDGWQRMTDEEFVADFEPVKP